MKNSMVRWLVFITAVLLIAGCSPCKRLQKRCPPQVLRERYDSLITRDTIIYRDKIVKIRIPGDTVFAEKKVPVKEDISPVWLQNEYASASAWVENSKLKLELVQKEQVITAIIDSAMKESKHWKEKYLNERQIETVKEKYIPKIYKQAMSICIFIFAAGFLFIGWKAYKFFT